MRDIQSFVCGGWIGPDSSARGVFDAVDGTQIGVAGSLGFDRAGMVDYAKSVGGPALRAMTFHERAKMLKALALYLSEQKDALYEVSYATGATLRDHRIDVDGGIGTMLVIASKGRREMPNTHVYVDGQVEQLSRGGQFVGQHICTPKLGVAVHINAFNFPVWGMLEKMAPALLAGMPVIVKPATATCQVTELAFKMIIASDLLPAGVVQLITGDLGNLLDHLEGQDVVSFTGSEATGCHLRTHPALIQNAVHFMAEQDSLNASVLGADVALGSAEFDLFVKEVHSEIIVKAGQKCTAVRRVMVPDHLLDPVQAVLIERLTNTPIGNPRHPDTRMGALVSLSQRRDVLEKAAQIGAEADCVFGAGDMPVLIDADADKGAFVTPRLFRCDTPDQAQTVHDIEAFGPVSTLMGYRDADHATELLNRGEGSLVASVFTAEARFARDMVLGSAPYHGRLYINNATSAKESTGHGSPMPHLVHGGPGRAGGGEELGGVRGVMSYMQRTAVQATPDILSEITQRYVPNATPTPTPDHPFRRSYHQLTLGEQLITPERKITIEDIETFAHFTGDTFYAHMDAEAAKRNPFFPDRVAHGYLLLSFAAGLFVDPEEGPVLANTGLDELRFMKPVTAGEEIHVVLTVMAKTPRTDTYGEVRWHVRILNQDDEIAAEYQLLTMNAFELSGTT
ncbi:MAG: phenylacetic acid degradation bifunctional protein PaaZ [Paracoccaceae bacterium]|jgi:oxepin-CoA hydrolase/3-oxo-5,6-dehydrosuberyl-CoA semialdehyde dehydrogenase